MEGLTAILTLVFIVSIVFSIYANKYIREDRVNFFDAKNSKEYLSLRQWMWDNSLIIEYSESLSFDNQLSFPKRLPFSEEGDKLYIETKDVIIDVYPYVIEAIRDKEGVYRRSIYYIGKEKDGYKRKEMHIEITTIIH